VHAHRPAAPRPEAGRHQFADAINELQERGWIKVTWRKDGAPLPVNIPARFARCKRITTTSFGRWRYPVTWSTR
jgi:hypothetical protein